MKQETKKTKRSKRHRRVRAKIFGTAERPRLVVFRSNKHVYGQLVDDEKGRILVSASDTGMKKKKKRIEVSNEVGRLIAQKAKAKNISKVVFDRGGYAYHGNIKALAEGARAGGLLL